MTDPAIPSVERFFFDERDLERRQTEPLHRHLLLERRGVAAPGWLPGGPVRRQARGDGRDSGLVALLPPLPAHHDEEGAGEAVPAALPGRALPGVPLSRPERRPGALDAPAEQEHGLLLRLRDHHPELPHQQDDGESVHEAGLRVVLHVLPPGGSGDDLVLAVGAAVPFQARVPPLYPHEGSGVLERVSGRSRRETQENGPVALSAELQARVGPRPREDGRGLVQDPLHLQLRRVPEVGPPDTHGAAFGVDRGAQHAHLADRGDLRLRGRLAGPREARPCDADEAIDSGFGDPGQPHLPDVRVDGALRAHLRHRLLHRLLLLHRHVLLHAEAERGGAGAELLRHGQRLRPHRGVDHRRPGAADSAHLLAGDAGAGVPLAGLLLDERGAPVGGGGGVRQFRVRGGATVEHASDCRRARGVGMRWRRF